MIDLRELLNNDLSASALIKKKGNLIVSFDKKIEICDSKEDEDSAPKGFIGT